MIHNNTIEATNAFQELSKVTQDIYRKKKMMDDVKREFLVAQTIGLNEYLKKYNPIPYKTKVIAELLSTIQP
ncbi:hypothetical protein [Flavobacterium sp. J27]|uniref:hypothetical protein n=1 Tax=Flavobacterium sp. J27 TaxID=2060419 RepID=UPI001031A6F8|nr:hypothetical protein [Flavobacterium sp. J27]